MSPSLPGLSQIRSKRHAAKRRFKNSHPDPPIHLTGRNGEKFPPETLTSWWCEADSGSSKNELLGGSALHPNLFQKLWFHNMYIKLYNCIFKISFAWFFKGVTVSYQLGPINPSYISEVMTSSRTLCSTDPSVNCKSWFHLLRGPIVSHHKLSH